MKPILTELNEGYGYDSSILSNYDGFIIIKPGFLKYSDEIIKDLHKKDFIIIEAEEKTLNRREAENIYSCHKGKKFFGQLIEYMTSGPCLGMVLLSPFSDRESSISTLKHLKEKYRKLYGIDKTRNVLHSSDSYQSVLYEVESFFDTEDFRISRQSSNQR